MFLLNKSKLGLENVFFFLPLGLSALTLLSYWTAGPILFAKHLHRCCYSNCNCLQLSPVKTAEPECVLWGQQQLIYQQLKSYHYQACGSFHGQLFTELFSINNFMFIQVILIQQGQAKSQLDCWKQPDDIKCNFVAKCFPLSTIKKCI